MIRAFLLQPDVASVVVGKLDYQLAPILRQSRGDLFNELLLTLEVDGREQLVLVNSLEQLLVFVLALLFGIGERRYVTQLPIEVQLVRAARGEFQEFIGCRHLLW